MEENRQKQAPAKTLELTKIFLEVHTPWHVGFLGQFKIKTGTTTLKADVDPNNIQEIRDIPEASDYNPEAKAQVILYHGLNFYTQESREEIKSLRERALGLS